MGSRRALALVGSIAASACVGAPPVGGGATTPAPADHKALSVEYRGWLADGRTPARSIAFANARSGFQPIDPNRDEVKTVRAGDRLVFINEDRLALYVVVGKQPLVEAGARLVGAHIDTPAPRLDTRGLTRDNQTTLRASRYGSVKLFHWLYRPLAVVGTVARRNGEVVNVELGLHDDFALYGTQIVKGELVVIASSTPTRAGKPKPGAQARPPVTFVDELHRRYGIDAGDLETSELYLVPRSGPRLVGSDRQLIGGHGQDDRSNSYAAWRAVADIKGAPPITAIAMLVDREEVGSTGPVGAQSLFLDTVYAYLLRAQGSPATEATLGRAFAHSVALSADTPACVNPNWPEVHEARNGPVIGAGPALFPFTGRGGKMNGSAAHAERIAAVERTFRAARIPIQAGELGRVDEGGGGTIAKYLAHRGMDAVDIGVCVVSMHSPFELSSVHDMWSAYRGFLAWFEEAP